MPKKKANTFTPKETKDVVLPNGKTKTFVKGETYVNVSKATQDQFKKVDRG